MTALLEVAGLTKRFPGRRGQDPVYAVKDVGFALNESGTLALVGESGAGKTTTGRIVARLLDADGGTAHLNGREILGLRGRALKELRKSVQVIFQDPFSCFDPRVPIVDSVAEPFRVHTDLNRVERRARAMELAERVGLGRDLADRYPEELSGGQLQRAAIARALTLEPKLIICDEPVSALDVSIRAQVLNLMHDLQEERGLAYLFISHDLSLVEVIAERVAIMRAGQIVELGDTAQVFASPQDAYTAELLSSIPRLDRPVQGDPKAGKCSQ